MIINAESKAQSDKPPLPTGGKGPEGPDTRTCARLVAHLMEAGEVELTRLQYNQELVATTREVGPISFQFSSQANFLIQLLC